MKKRKMERKHGKKLPVVVLMATVMVLGVGGSSLVMAKEKNRVDPVNATTEYETYEVDESYVNESMEEFIQGLDMLTDEEKQLLIEEDRVLQPYIEKGQKISIEMEEKTNKILEGADEFFEERGDILLGENSNLWDTLWDNMSEEQNKMTDYHEIIKASKVLTESEKKILLKEQKRLDELDSEIAKYYQEAEIENSQLNKEYEENLKKIQEIKGKTKHIWDKVYKVDVVY